METTAEATQTFKVAHGVPGAYMYERITSKRSRLHSVFEDCWKWRSAAKLTVKICRENGIKMTNALNASRPNSPFNEKFIPQLVY